MMHSLPLFVRLAGRPVILLGRGEAADAKRRLLERAGAVPVGEDAAAALAIVAIEDEAAARVAVARLRARGVLVNAVDRPALCDFTIPAIVDRAPILVAIGTGGVSAGLAAALRQRIEALLPPGLGGLADALAAARGRLRELLPDSAARRRAIGAALAEGGALDPLAAGADEVTGWLREITALRQAQHERGKDEEAQPRSPVRPEPVEGQLVRITLTTDDPDDLTLRQARQLALADRVLHAPGVAPAILARARADAPRTLALAPPEPIGEGLTVFLERV